MKTYLCALLLGLAAVPAALADAIPMRVDLSAAQAALIGTWHEDAPNPLGFGHTTTQRTIVFGNEDAVVVSFGAISYSNDYSVNAMKGAWTAEPADGGALKVTMVQTPDYSMVWTIVMDGDNGLLLKNGEAPNMPASHFTRIGGKIAVSK